MSISSNIRTAGPYSGNGAARTFPFPFKVFQPEDLLVFRRNTITKKERVLVYGTDYSVSLNANQNSAPGGSISLTYAMPAGRELIITSGISLLQPADLTNQGGFYPTVINDALDRLCIQLQQLQTDVTRSVKVSLFNPAGLDDLVANIDILGSRIAEIELVVANLTHVIAVSDNMDDVRTVRASIVNVNRVGDSITNVNTVGNHIARVNAVAANAENITNVAQNKANIDALAGQLPDLVLNTRLRSRILGGTVTDLDQNVPEMKVHGNACFVFMQGVLYVYRYDSGGTGAPDGVTVVIPAGQPVSTPGRWLLQNMVYRNTASGLTATTVQAAIDEIVAQTANLVHNTGNETIAGVKTFTEPPVVPDASEPSQAIAYGQIAQANAPSVKTALNATGDAPVYACRAWAQFTGSGSIQLLGSANVSSLVDHGLGNYSMNFAEAMPTNSFAVTALGGWSHFASGMHCIYSGTSRVQVGNAIHNAYGARDCDVVYITVFA